MILRLLTFPFRYTFGKLKKVVGKLDKIKIEPLYAFGNEDCIYVKGRVIEAYKQSKPSHKKNSLQNIVAALRRYAGSSVPDAKVEVTYFGQKKALYSDEEGIISCEFHTVCQETSEVHRVRFSLVEEEGLVSEKSMSSLKVQQFSKNHPIGVISDIDDTVLISHATDIGKKLWLSVSKNAFTRRPFPGVSGFYRELTENGKHPIFYVSSSDWNLYDLIKDFLAFRKIPAGPILLQDLHLSLKNIWKSGGGSHQHKLEKIKMLLDMYPGMRFFLIGDSGQHDPELYGEVIREYPERIKSVYIRKVSDGKEEGRTKLIEELKKIGESPQMVFVKNTQEAIKHAKQHEFIPS
ncbi:App1 family protein [Echinicola rosea]|uniref:Phosphatase n=1 Tax=Echinicola rosea TaxID=1807691 RepID=A0ABQ1UF05_9BACT|nr:phosphatase domain-containing protein [Echinicola rosea]GGF17347.1 phosphatase [Echinicola rosea]